MQSQVLALCLAAAASLAGVASSGALPAAPAEPAAGIAEGTLFAQAGEETAVVLPQSAAPDSAAADTTAAGAVKISGTVPAALPAQDEAPRRKRAPVAIFSTAAFPALGQLYNEEGFRTVLVFVWESYYIARIIRDGYLADFYKRKANDLGEDGTWRGLTQVELRLRFYKYDSRMRDYVWYFSALLIASMLDAYVFAHLHSFDADDIRKAAILPTFGLERRSLGLQLRLSF